MHAETGLIRMLNAAGDQSSAPECVILSGAKNLGTSQAPKRDTPSHLCANPAS
jgi:hypothetical protein